MSVLLFLIALILLYLVLDRSLFIGIRLPSGEYIKVSRNLKRGEPIYRTSRFPDGEIESQIMIDSATHRYVMDYMLSSHIASLLDRL